MFLLLNQVTFSMCQVEPLETQQSSDTTYHVYDYDRRDAEGNLRDLHLEKAIEVTTVPHQDTVNEPTIKEQQNVRIITFVESEFFSVYKWDVWGKAAFSFHDQYLLLSVIKGEGALINNGEQYELTKGLILLSLWVLENLK